MLKAISKKPKLPLKPKETKIREANFYEMKEREESSSIFVVWERLYI